MIGLFGKFTGAVGILLAVSSAASAREDYCITPGTRQIDRNATAQLQQLEATANPTLQRLLAGVWLRQTRNPATGQTSNNFQQYQANGLWQYVDTVCDASGRFCSRYSGVGVFGARFNPSVQNGFVGIISVSDSTRNHQCIGLNGRFINATTIVDSTGTVLRKVQ